MKIPEYKKRAAIAAEKWKSLQAQKNLESMGLHEKNDVTPEIEGQKIEQTTPSNTEKFAIPKTAIKGIQITKSEQRKERLRDTA